MSDHPFERLESFDYTHVLYDPRSTTSEVLALFTLFPILLFASYAALVLVTRELTIVMMLLGQLSNELLNTYVKEYLKVERPLTNMGKGYGFPSSHSQYMGFFATFLICHLSYRHTFPSHNSRVVDMLVRATIYSALVGWACLVAYSRYYLRYHSPIQVIGGLTVGVVYGVLWYTLVEYLPLQFPDSILGRIRTGILDSSLSKWMRVRDGWAVFEDGGHEEEWIEWDRKRRKLAARGKAKVL